MRPHRSCSFADPDLSRKPFCLFLARRYAVSLSRSYCKPQAITSRSRIALVIDAVLLTPFRTYVLLVSVARESEDRRNLHLFAHKRLSQQLSLGTSTVYKKTRPPKNVQMCAQLTVISTQVPGDSLSLAKNILRLFWVFAPHPASSSLQPFFEKLPGSVKIRSKFKSAQKQPDHTSIPSEVRAPCTGPFLPSKYSISGFCVKAYLAFPASCFFLSCSSSSASTIGFHSVRVSYVHSPFFKLQNRRMDSKTSSKIC